MHVKLTESIKEQIINKIDALFIPRYDEIEKNLQGKGDEIYRAVISEEKERIANSISEFVQHVSKISLLSPRRNSWGGEQYIELKLGRARPCPRALIHWNQSLLVKDYEQIKDVISEEVQEAKKVLEERNKLVDSTKEILNKCGTLRRAVQVWPTVLDFVDQKVLNKYYEEAPKTPKEKEERAQYKAPEISDETKLLLIKARLTEGGSSG